MNMQKILLLAIGAVFATSITVSAKEIAIIANKNNPLTRTSATELADIYRGQEEVISGVRLKPIDQSDSQEIRALFLTKVMRMSHEAYINYWNHRLFQEGGIPPVLKNDSSEVISTVRDKEGAIGYIWASEAKGVEGIRVILTIDASE